MKTLVDVMLSTGRKLEGTRLMAGKEFKGNSSQMMKL